MSQPRAAFLKNAGKPLVVQSFRLPSASARRVRPVRLSATLRCMVPAHPRESSPFFALVAARRRCRLYRSDPVPRAYRDARAESTMRSSMAVLPENTLCSRQRSSVSGRVGSDGSDPKPFAASSAGTAASALLLRSPSVGPPGRRATPRRGWHRPIWSVGGTSMRRVEFFPPRAGGCCLRGNVGFPHYRRRCWSAGIRMRVCSSSRGFNSATIISGWSPPARQSISPQGPTAMLCP